MDDIGASFSLRNTVRIKKKPAKNRGSSIMRTSTSAVGFLYGLARYAGGQSENVAGRWLNALCPWYGRLAMMFGGGAMRFGRILVMLGCLVMFSLEPFAFLRLLVA